MYLVLLPAIVSAFSINTTHTYVHPKNLLTTEITPTISIIAAMASTTIIIVSRDPCHDWPLGECKHGNECTREHHDNLDPALVDIDKAHSEYMVPNEVGEACQRCMQRMYPASSRPIKCSSYANSAQCDKKGRDGEDDPCSECR